MARRRMRIMGMPLWLVLVIAGVLIFTPFGKNLWSKAQEMMNQKKVS